MKITQRKLFILVITIFLFQLNSILIADVIHLKNGRRVSGQIILETETQVTLKTVLGRMVIKRDDIARIQREEDKIIHIRNGDYFMARGDYDSAIGQYEIALQADPTNPDVAFKLADARRKAASALSERIAPEFARGDEFLNRGFFDSAIREYNNVVQHHNNDPVYVAEAEKKIKNVATKMLHRATELAYQNDYNRSFELFQQAIDILPKELSLQSRQNFDEVLNQFFAEPDRAFNNGQFSQAILGYNQLTLTYPGEQVRHVVRNRMERITVDLTYQWEPEENWDYITRAQFSIDPPALAMLGTLPGVFQQMEFVLDNSYRIIDTTGDGNMELEWTLNNGNLMILEPTGRRQNFNLPDFTGKQLSGQISPRGDFTRDLNITRVVYNTGITGERLDQNSFVALISLLPRLPVVKPGQLRIGDNWIEGVNERRNMGPLELSTNGQIEYNFAGFETLAGRDCSRLNIEMRLTHILRGIMGSAEEGNQQNVDLTLETPLTGTAFICHNQGEIVRYALNGNINMRGQILGVQTIQQQQILDPVMLQGEGMGPMTEFGGELAPRHMPQTQTRQQTLPEVSVRVLLERNLVQPSTATD